MRALPTRGVVYTAVALLALIVVGFALWLRVTDAEGIRTAIGAWLEDSLGEPVELGEVELALLPLPAASIRDVRIGAAPRVLLEAPEIRVGISLLGLLSGDVVVRSMALESPSIHLPVNTPSPDGGGTRSDGSRWQRSGGAPSRVQLAITRLRVRDGSLEAGVVRLEHLELQGDLGGAEPAVFEFTAESGGLARLEQGRLELSALAAPLADWRWNASAKLVAVDLGELGKRVELAGFRGTAEGLLSASGHGLTSEAATLQLASRDLVLAGAGLQARGAATFEGELPSGVVRVDLRDAIVAYGDQIQKPAGVALSLAGTLAELARPLRLHDVRIESDALRATGEIDLSGRPSLVLRTGAIDLSALSAWHVPDWMPRSGHAQVESAQLRLAPPEAEGAGELSDVVVALPGGATASVSGRAWARETSVGGEDLHVVIAGESIAGSARYDWQKDHVELIAMANGARVTPLSEALLQRSDLSGRLYGRIDVAGPLDWYSLTGTGELELTVGQYPRISLARAAGLEVSFEESPELDHFEKLGAVFAVAGDHLEVEELTIAQDYAIAALHGQIYLRTLTADLIGNVLLSYPELPVPSLRPIPRAGGSLTELEIDISNAETEDDQKMEASMIAAIRKVEKERREGRAAPEG